MEEESINSVKKYLFFISLLLLILVSISTTYMYYIYKETENNKKMTDDYMEKWERTIKDIKDEKKEAIVKKIDELPSTKFEKETAHIRLRSNEQVENYQKYLEVIL